MSILGRAVRSCPVNQPALLSKIHAPLPAPCEIYVCGPEIGDGSTPVPATLIGVSCYPGEQLTFWVQGEGGWLYSYLPQHYLSTCLGGSTAAEGLEDLFLVPQHSGFVVDAPLLPVVRLRGQEYKVLALVDFMDSNELAWILAHPSGAVRVLPHRLFDATLPPGGLRKMRATWK